MYCCPHCQTPIKLRKLKADFSYDRNLIPWYKPVEAKYTCPQCHGLFSPALRRTPWLQASIFLLVIMALKIFLDPIIVETFSLTGVAARFATHELWVIPIGIGSGVLAHLNTHLVPVVGT